MGPARGRLLVVDDSAANRDTLAALLRLKGYDVATAGDGRQALEQLAAAPVDLVLLDVMMQDVSGLEVLEEIRRARPATDLPVIMATARDQSEDIVRALRLGANDYVTKPLDLPVLLARIQTQLSLKRAVARAQGLEQSLARQNTELESANCRLTEANQRMRHDLELAARIQEAFLPPPELHFPGAEVAWVYKPCTRLAGDTLNAFAVGERHLGLYVLDVSGHGVPAALLAVTLSHLLSPHTEHGSLLCRRGAMGPAPVAPAEVLRQLNRRFTLDAKTEQYFTIAYGLLDADAGEFRYALAGHPGPVYAPRDAAVTVLNGPGLPIGFGHPDYVERSVRLRPGDRLYLYSDGLSEAPGPDNEMFGRDRLLSAVARHRALDLAASVQAFWADVDRWCAGDAARDDMSILALEFTGVPLGAGAAVPRRAAMPS